MKTKIEIGTLVTSKKHGEGVIVKIITKSTGYVQVDFNGVLKNEMAFNLTVNGESLKNKSVKKEITEQDIIDNAKDFARINARLNYALSQETGRTGTTEFLKSI